MSMHLESTVRTAAQLQRLADEARVRACLAGPDAQRAWEELEPRLLRFQMHAHHANRRGVDAVQRAGTELEDEIRALLTRLKR